MDYVELTWTDLLLSLTFILLALGLAYWQRIDIKRDMSIGTIRTFVQLIAVGYILEWLFNIRNVVVILAILLMMIAVASWEGTNRPTMHIPHLYPILYFSITVTTAIVVGMTFAFIIPVNPLNRMDYFVPLAGILIGNALNGAALTADRLASEIQQRRLEIESALALGASTGDAINLSFRMAVKAAMIPSINSLMTVGIVHLPGIMVGQILAGTPPIQAIRYQIIIMYMLISTKAIGSIITGMLVYREFFTSRHQLKIGLLQQGE
ncbi:MAG TPA: iron export ABC transporter permease subunit FetB [bacterium]|nr:iron export ABC transporter permease subunit FetB [bacterium]